MVVDDTDSTLHTPSAKKTTIKKPVAVKKAVEKTAHYRYYLFMLYNGSPPVAFDDRDSAKAFERMWKPLINRRYIFSEKEKWENQKLKLSLHHADRLYSKNSSDVFIAEYYTTMYSHQVAIVINARDHIGIYPWFLPAPKIVKALTEMNIKKITNPIMKQAITNLSYGPAFNQVAANKDTPWFQAITVVRNHPLNFMNYDIFTFIDIPTDSLNDPAEEKAWVEASAMHIIKGFRSMMQSLEFYKVFLTCDCKHQCLSKRIFDEKCGTNLPKFLANTTFETREIEYLSETLGTFVMNKVHKRMQNSSTDIPKYIGCYAAHSNSEILDGDIQSMGKFPHSTLF